MKRMNNLLSLCLLALTLVAASAADDRTPAQKMGDRRVAQTIAWAVIGQTKGVEKIERPSETPANDYIAAGREAYLTFARSEERGDAKGTAAAVKAMLVEKTNDALTKAFATELDAFAAFVITDATKVSDLQEALTGRLWDRVPEYRKMLVEKTVGSLVDLNKALAQHLMAGQAIRVLEAEAKAKAEGTTKL